MEIKVAQVVRDTGAVKNVIMVDTDNRPTLDPAYDWIDETEATGPVYRGGKWTGTAFEPPPDNIAT